VHICNAAAPCAVHHIGQLAREIDRMSSAQPGSVDERCELTKDAKAAVAHPHVVHRTAVASDPAIYVLIGLVLVVLIASGGLVYMDTTLADSEKRNNLIAVACSTVATLVTFLLVMPKEFEVVSDASINVVTFVSIKWHFGNVTAAYDGEHSPSHWSRPKIKFATTCGKHVVVRRKNGGWDLLLSPHDPEQFIKAVFQVAADNEEN
jgi:hypothetical protein